MRRSYPAVVDRDGAIFGISFPDFPGCVSSADTPEAAIAAGREALSGHVALMVEDGDPLPEPTPLDHVIGMPDEQVVRVALVTVPLPGRVRRYSVSLDESLVAEIDRIVGHDGRSRFLAQAVRTALARQTGDDPEDRTAS